MQILFKSLTTFLNLYVSSMQGPSCSSSKNSVCTCHPCTKGKAKTLCAIQKKLIPGGRENHHSCAGAPNNQIRTFGRAVDCSSVPPLTNTMGGLSGGGRGGDTSGVSSAPSFVIARLRARALALERLPQEGILKSVIFENVAQMSNEMLLKL